MSHLPSASSKRILELDGLRAFAVICVVIYHMCDYAGSLPQGPYGVAAIVTFLGPSGVDIFFIISGYIITTLLLREKSNFGYVSLKAFYTRRFFRIIPPLFTYLVGLLAIRSLGFIHVSNCGVLWSALFLGNTGLLDSQSWFVGHTWSLSVEEQFYLIFPPLLCGVFRFRTRLVVLALGMLYGLCVVAPKLAHALSSHFAPQCIGLSNLHHFRYIIVGVVLATHGASLRSFLVNKSRIWPLSFAASAYFLQCVSVPPMVSVLFAAIQPCFCGLLVMWFMQNPDRCGLLRLPMVQWLGACSYSIYLWQQLFTSPAQFYVGWKLAQSSLSIFAIAICAAVSFYLIEQPSIRLGRFLSRRMHLARNAGEGGVSQPISSEAGV